MSFTKRNTQILFTIVMGIFLVLFDRFVDVNAFTGVIEVAFGAGICFGTMFLIGGLTREDFELLKNDLGYNNVFKTPFYLIIYGSEECFWGRWAFRRRIPKISKKT